MQEGAFALIDCLGFKGVWKRTNPQLLLEKLGKIERAVNERDVTNNWAFKNLSFGPVRAHVRLLSDTVAISLQYEERENEKPTDKQLNYLVGLICHSVVKILDLFLDGEPPLVLRGCITYGEHISEGNFIVGPAVDDAAEHMNIAEGAFVWLHPTAATRYRNLRKVLTDIFESATPSAFAAALREMKDPEGKLSSLRQAIEEQGEEAVGEALINILRLSISTPVVIDPYNMPLKAGGYLQCSVINPLAFHKSAEERQAIIDMYSKVISGNKVDIWLKHQNTIEFLEEANGIWSGFEEIIAPLRKTDSQEGDKQ